MPPPLGLRKVTLGTSGAWRLMISPERGLQNPSRLHPPGQVMGQQGF